MKKIKRIIILFSILIIGLFLIIAGVIGAITNIKNSYSGNGTINSDSLKNLNEEQKAFIDSISDGAMKNFKEYKIFPSITIAQAILEGTWGKSQLSLLGKNLFGVKADPSWKGQTISMRTTENYGNGSVSIMAIWRVYDSFDASVENHGKFLYENSRYALYGVFEATNYKEQITAIHNAGYATDPNYAVKICEVIETHGLNYLDGVTTNADNGSVDNAISIGKTLIGNSTYSFGGGRNDSDIQNRYFDCSSFIHYIFASSGVQFGSRESVTTYSLVTQGTVVEKEGLEKGDLIFFNTVGINSHVGLYLGDNKFIHCSTSSGVIISEFKGYYESVFYTARRVI